MLIIDMTGNYGEACTELDEVFDDSVAAGIWRTRLQRDLVHHRPLVRRQEDSVTRFC